MRQRLRDSTAGFVEVGDRALEAVLTIDGVGARTPVSQESIASIEGERAALEAEVPPSVQLPGRTGREQQPTARARVGLLFENDVDDASCPRRIVACRRIG